MALARARPRGSGPVEAAAPSDRGPWVAEDLGDPTHSVALVRPMDDPAADARVEVAPGPEPLASAPVERVTLRLVARAVAPASASRELHFRVSPVRGSPAAPRLFDGFGLRLQGEEAERFFAGEARSVDVSSLFRFGAPHALVVRAEGDDLSAVELVPCEEGARELEALLWLAPGVRVAGQVAPAEAREVAAFLMLGERPTALFSGDGAVRSDGGYELVLPGGHDYALCAFGAGRPGTLVARLGRSAVQYLPTLHLPPEAVIQGGVGFAYGLPWDRSSVSAELVGGTGTYSVGRSDFTWFEGAFEWRGRERTLGRGELLELDGLAPAVYELSLSGVAGPERVAVGRLPAVRVRAPALAVDIAPRVARVRFQAERDGVPVAGAPLPLVQDFGARGSSHLQGVTDERGIAEFWLDPDAPAWTPAESEGGCGSRFVPRERDGTAPCAVLVAGESASGR